jgi:anti-sigma B factor antagonist
MTRAVHDPRHRFASVAALGRLDIRTVLVDGNRAYLRVSGELDLATAPVLAAVIRRHLFAGRRFIRLDLSGLGFLDCTGLLNLAQAHNECLARRGTLVMSHVGTRVLRLLELTELDAALFFGDGVSGPSSVRRSRRRDGRATVRGHPGTSSTRTISPLRRP